MKIELPNASEILNRHKNDTDHWADQEWDNEGVLAAMQEYGELCTEYGAKSIRYQMIEMLGNTAFKLVNEAYKPEHVEYIQELIEEIQNLNP